MRYSVNPLLWESDFPVVMSHTSISFLKNCPGYPAAKNGDNPAALKVVSHCAKPHPLNVLPNRYPHASLLPVITRNKLPEALAQKIALPVCLTVQAKKNIPRKNMSSMERLLYKPIFDGEITSGKVYIIIDDILTQGGTVAALRKHVISRGGSVAAVMTLAFAAGSQFLAPHKQELATLSNKFSLRAITALLRYYDIADDLRELTRSQIKYLLRFETVTQLHKKIEGCLTGDDMRGDAQTRRYSPNSVDLDFNTFG